jgi:hypothetical protein
LLKIISSFKQNFSISKSFFLRQKVLRDAEVSFATLLNIKVRSESYKEDDGNRKEATQNLQRF